MDYKLFDKKTESGAIATTKVWVSVNEELAQELHKLVIEKFKRRKTYTNRKDNIWAADLDELGSFSSKNWGIKDLLSLIVVFTKYARVKSLKDKESKTVFRGFIEIVNEIVNINQIIYGLINEENFTITLGKKYLYDNDVLMYLSHNEGKSVVSEMFIWTLKDKISKKNDN